MNKPPFPKKLKVELSESKYHGYESWNTFSIRDARTNVCIAVVGEIDAYYSEGRTYEQLAMTMAAAPEMLELIRVLLTNNSVQMPIDLAIELDTIRKKLTFI